MNNPMKILKVRHLEDEVEADMEAQEGAGESLRTSVLATIAVIGFAVSLLVAFYGYMEVVIAVFSAL